MSGPDASTRLAAVIGHPVAHSLSPAIHNAALRHDGLNATYLAFDVPPAGLADAMRGLVALGAAGVNVTVPHKLAVLEHVTARSPEVQRVGAANLLLFGDGGIEAHNTDVDGVLRAFSDLAGPPAGMRCLVLGAGGAGRAAAWALRGAGADVVLANRTSARAEHLAAEVGCAWVAWNDVHREVGSVEAVVNATSVGLEDRTSPLDDGLLGLAAAGGCRAVLDLVYGADGTELVRRARRAGIPSADGVGMLVHQAAAAYALLWGRPAPLPVMTDAARRASGSRDLPGRPDPGVFV